MKRIRPAFEPRLRVSRNGRHLFGPGMAALLQAIADTGSLRRSAASLGMSYQRAWNLARQMNAHFVRPLVILSRGGGGGGGAVPSATGRRVLALYGRMEQNCRTATRRDWAALRRLMR